MSFKNAAIIYFLLSPLICEFCQDRDYLLFFISQALAQYLTQRSPVFSEGGMYGYKNGEWRDGLDILGCDKPTKGEVFLEVGYWLLARIELVIVRSQPCGYASLDTARISCPLLPAPSQTKPHTKHWNFLLTLPTEFKLQVIREGFCFFLIFWPYHTACGILVP